MVSINPFQLSHPHSPMPTPPFPLTAFVGYIAARRALLCTLVDPELRGVVLAGTVGSGKSALMRGFGAFVRAYVDSEMPFVQVPIGVDDNRLIGGLDLDAALAAGERRERAGLVAGAHGGFLFVDDLPLLDELAMGAIAGALERQMLLCEREGVSACNASRFVLLATVVPTERELPVWIADKVAFLIAEERQPDADTARRVLARLDAYTRWPEQFVAEYRERELELAAQVTTARMIHSLIPVDSDVAQQLVEAAIQLNVPGNRADIFAAKAARAHAALRGSRRIEEVDIKFAIATVLRPRLQNIPDESQQSEQEGKAPETPSEGGDADRHHDRERESGGERSESGSAPEGMEERGVPDAKTGGERMYEALDFNGMLPDLQEFFALNRSNTTPGSRGEREQWRRGRHTRSLHREVRGKQVAVGATLRAAAPHQLARRGEGEGGIIVRGEDIRVKRYSERAGTLFIFCVDASGSMAMNRMREAKGAVAKLLQDAYVNRDTVALIAFRGGEAEILLPPTNSVERAKRSLDVLPTGGGTPLASALIKAYGLVAASRRKGVERTLVIFLTDGRANVPLTESAAGMIMEIRRRHVRQELERVTEAYRREGVSTLVIDTKQTFGAQSEATRLAQMLGGRYYYLPRIDAQGLAQVVKEMARR